MTVPFMNRRTLIASEAALSLPRVASAQSTTIPADQISAAFSNPVGQIRALGTNGTQAKIEGTYNASYQLSNVVANHVQGIAWIPGGRTVNGGRFALCQNTSGDHGLFAVQKDDSDSSSFLWVGSGDHPGGLQACGKIVVVPIKGDAGKTVHFINCSNAVKPYELVGLRITSTVNIEAAGIAYDAVRRCHWVVTTGTYGYKPDGDIQFYRSNGLSLTSRDAQFSRGGSIPGFVSQGGFQILFDRAGVMYLAALYRVESAGEKHTATLRQTKGSNFVITEEGYEHIGVSRVDNLDNLTVDAANGASTQFLLDKKLSDSGLYSNPGPGFRWGGTIGGGSTKLFAAATSRVMSYGPAAPYTYYKFWS